MFKKVVALLCAITMMTASLGLQMLVDASDTTNFTELTFASCGIDDGVHTLENNLDRSGAHPNGLGILNNVAFTGNIQFANKGSQFNWNDALVFAGVFYLTYDNQNGKLHLMRRDNGNSYLQTISKQQLGVDPATTPIRVRFTFAYVTSDTTEQVKYTFSANGINTEGTIDKAHSTIGAWMSINLLVGETIVESVYPKEDGEEEITTFEELTFSDWGVDNQTFEAGENEVRALSNRENLNGVAFTGNVTFHKASSGDTNDAIWIGGKTNGWGGFTLLYVDGEVKLRQRTGVDSTLVSKKASDLDITAVLNTPLKIRLTFAYVGTTDVAVTFSINDVCYYDQTITGIQQNLGTYMMLYGKTNATMKTSIESITAENQGLSQVTYADFLVSDGTHTTTRGGAYPGSIEKTVLSGDVNFGNGTGESIIFGGATDKGLRITHTAEGKLKVIADSNVATNLLNETELEQNSNNDNGVIFSEPTGVDFESNMSLSISVEKGSYDSDEVADDAKVGIWANGQLLGKRYLYLADAFDGSHMTSNCYVSGGTDSLTIQSLETDTTRCRKLRGTDFGFADNTVDAATDSLLNTEVSMNVKTDNTNITSSEGYAYIDYGEKKLTNLTFSNFGLTEDKEQGNITVACQTVDSLDGTIFTGKIKFGAVESDYNNGLWIGGKAGWQGVAVIYAAGQLILYDKTAGPSYTTVANGTIGKNPTETAVEISLAFEYVEDSEVWVRFCVEGTQYYYGKIGSTPEQMGNYMMLYTTATPATTYIESVTNPIDAGTPGVRLQVMDDKIVVKQTSGLFDAFEIPASVLGVDTYNNKSFDLKLSYTMVDLDRDGEEDEVRFSISVNGKTCANRYLDDYDLVTNRYMSIHPSQAQVTLQDVDFDSENFETLTIEHFGMEPTEFKYTNGSMQGHHSYTGGSLDGKIFSTNIKFSTYDSLLFYGSKTLGSWYSLYIGPQDGAGTNAEKDNRWRFLVQYPEGQLGSTQFIDATDAGVKLVNNTFELGISTRNVDCDGDKQVDDLELGLWFDGKLLENSYIYAVDKADTLQPHFAVLIPTDRGSLTMGDIVETTPTEIEHCADKYAYMVDADTTTIETIEGATYADNTTAISTPGVYNVTYKDAESTYMDQVTVYIEQDATADGVVTVQDLVRLKLLQNDVDTEITTAGKRALSMEEVLPENAVADMHARLLQTNIIGAKEMSEEILGEMGPASAPTGSYISNVAQTTEGTSVISISGNQDSKWQSTLAKHSGSGLDYILDLDVESFETNREIRVLQITDTQIIDSTQNAQSLTEQQKQDYNPENRDEMLWDEVDTLIKDTKPDLVLVTGDLTYGKYDHNGTAMQDLANHLDSYRIPWAPILGNHELESDILAQGICDIFENADYCLFTRRGEIGGNGNYSIGIAKNGVLVKTIFMMDSNGSNKNANELPYVSSDANYIEGENIIGSDNSFLLFDKQMAWYRTVAAKVNEFAETTVNSFLCVHVPPEEVRSAVQDMDLQDSSIKDWELMTTEGNTNATIGFKNSSDGKDEEDGGKKMDDYIYPYLQQAGTEGVFFGHCHKNAMSMVWQGIRWTYGLKTGLYEGNPDKTGGTLITIKEDASFVVEHKVITETTAD